MKLISGLILLLVLPLSAAPCQMAVLKGDAAQFADSYLIINKIVNPITGESVVIDTLFIDHRGQFLKEVQVSKPEWVFINTGIFRLTLFLNPGKGYVLSLPPHTTKSEADIRNPFYKPRIASLIVLREYPLEDESMSISGTDINTKIFRFDTLIASRNIEMIEARRKQKNYNSDSAISTLEKLYKNDTSVYFKNYRRFRYGIIKINSRDIGLQHIYEQYLATETPETDNPAYMELFGEMYKEFLFYYSRTKEGNSINFLVNNKHELGTLKDTLVKHDAIPNKKLAELIIIKEIFDIYSKDYFKREALLSLLDSIIDHPEIEDYGYYARGVKTYLTRLKPGGNPPPFLLLDQKNKQRSLEDFMGKYVYLNFCTPDNYSCLKEFPFLDVLYNAHGKYLEIVTIMVTDEIDKMIDFMKKNQYKWTALFYGNDEKLLQNYDVKAYPTCYLIGPDGKIIQSPATLATEGFEQELFNIMKSRGDL